MALTEGLLRALFADAGIEIPRTVQAHELRGMRWSATAAIGRTCVTTCRICDVNRVFRGADFGITRSAIDAGGRVRGIRIPGGAALSRKQVDEIEADREIRRALLVFCA